jgi:hypothetical protein
MVFASMDAKRTQSAMSIRFAPMVFASMDAKRTQTAMPIRFAPIVFASIKNAKRTTRHATAIHFSSVRKVRLLEMNHARKMKVAVTANAFPRVQKISSNVVTMTILAISA